MFYGYSASQWIGLGEWFIIVLVLSIGIGAMSCICTNKTLHKDKVRNNNTKRNLKEKKSYFIDVA